MSDSVKDVIEDIKNGSDRLDELMGEYKRAMEATGTEFQGEDIGYLSGAIEKRAEDIANRFGLLRTMEKVEKRRIDEAEELKKAKEELKERSGVGEAEGKVEETREVEKGSEAPEGGSKKTEGVQKRKESEVEKPKARDLGDAEKRKEVIAAARRLGMEAYKPDEVLQKMLETAKAHMSDPRHAQRAKDIETILADRKVKGKREVTEAEKREGRAEQKFRDRMSGGGRTPSEEFYSRERDNTEGLGNQEVDEEDDEVAEKKDKGAEDEKPESAREIVARLVLEALEV